MRVLLTGASGFIGGRLAAALRARGHEVIAGQRRASATQSSIAVDFTRDLDPNDWKPRLQQIDAVVNAVGILRERGEHTFERIHTRAPQALFAACAAVGVKRVIQISALGADRGSTGYFRSKHAADEYLSTLPLAWTIVQPSLVYAEGGTSARLFTMMASLPVVPLPAGGSQQVQPIHVDDLTDAVVRLLETNEFERQKVALVGPAPLSFRDFLLTLRRALSDGSRRTLTFPVPRWSMRLAAEVGERLPNALLDRETLTMLNAGNTADPAATARLLGREPRHVDAFIRPQQRESLAVQAKLAWLAPLLRLSIALVWLWTGVVSLGLYPREQSYELLARTGAPPALAPLLLFGAAVLDFLFGIATLVLRRRQWLWLAQIALILLYTVIITFRLPEYWLHPYGPILKNLPMLAAIYLLYVLEKK